MKLLNKKDQERFKLNIKAHIAYKNPYHFRKYYTGGPMKVQTGDPFFVKREEEKDISIYIFIYNLHLINIIFPNIRVIKITLSVS